MKVKNFLFAGLAASAICLNAEQIPFDAKLTGWNKAGTRNAYPDSRIKHSKIGSVRLESGATVYRSLELEPDTYYDICFAVKGENLESGENLGAAIILGANNRYTRVATKSDNSPEAGTFDWKKGRVRISTSRFKTGKIQMSIRVNGNGTAWYDSMEICKIANPDTNTLSLLFDSDLTNWHKGGSRLVQTDSQIKPDSVPVRLDTGAGISRFIELDVDSEYEISFGVKGENLESGNNRGAKIILGGNNRYLIAVANADKSPESGTFDWKKGTVRFNTSRFQTGKLNIAFVVTGKGIAWYDSVEIRKILK